MSSSTEHPQPPRPDVKVGALLIIVGSIVTIVGVLLPWVTARGESQSGTGILIDADLDVYDAPGNTVIFFAAITLGLGVTLFFAGRVLAVAIIAIVAASVAWLIGVALFGIASDTVDVVDGSLGYGAILQPVAPLITLAGAIVATSTRRRWAAPDTRLDVAPS